MCWDHSGQKSNTYLKENRTVAAYKVGGKVAIASEIFDGHVEGIQPLNEELGPRQHLVIVTSLGREKTHALGIDPIEEGALSGIE